MTMQDWTRLKEDAQELLDSLNLSKLTKNGFVTLGACVAILDHVVKEGQEAVQATETEAQTKTEPLHSNPQVTLEKLKEIVKEEIAGIEMYTDMEEFEVAKQEAEHAMYFLSKLKARATTNEDITAVRELWSHLSLAKSKLR